MKTSSYRRKAILCGLAIAATAGWISGAAAQTRTFSFAYDQPTTTAYGIAANIFDAKLKELTGGKMSINQFPGAQLGQEPQMLQKMRAGDIDFVITSTANASTLAPQAGVFSLHFIFRDQNHLAKALADPAIAQEFRAMVKDSVQGAQVLGLLTMGMRNMYSKKEVTSDRRRQGPEGSRAGDQDRGHAVPGLRRADRAHAVRRGLHVAADRRGQRRRERRQRLSRQQALRSGADPVDDRARGEQQLHLGQRQDLEQPDAAAAGVGAGGRRRGEQDASRRWR